jgi:hypothetical protein
MRDTFDHDLIAMTDTTMPLLELLQKRGGSDSLKALSEAVVRRLMRVKVGVGNEKTAPARLAQALVLAECPSS